MRVKISLTPPCLSTYSKYYLSAHSTFFAGLSLNHVTLSNRYRQTGISPWMTFPRYETSFEVIVFLSYFFFFSIISRAASATCQTRWAQINEFSLIMKSMPVLSFSSPLPTTVGRTKRLIGQWDVRQSIGAPLVPLTCNYNKLCSASLNGSAFQTVYNWFWQWFAPLQLRALLAFETTWPLSFDSRFPSNLWPIFPFTFFFSLAKGKIFFIALLNT